MIISKLDFKKILAKMTSELSYTLAAPASNGKKQDFLEISDINNIVMDDSIAYKSPKEFFFPRCEKLFSFQEEAAVASEPAKPFIIFGVKPCDLEALDVMAKIFTQGRFNDPFFASNMDNNLVIGVGCQEKKPGCFCDSLSIDMNFSDKCDIFLESIGDEFRLIYVSDRGRAKFSPFIKGLDDFENLKSENMSKSTIENQINEKDFFEKVDWETATETCQGCGLCTFICPSCHCFDFKDVQKDGVASRYRLWDSCMYPKFTLHASGHNPRESKAERYRQRVLHKYVYIPQNVGACACTGCGRCIRSCPAGVDIRKITEKMEVVK